MLDDLRNSSTFIDEEEELQDQEESVRRYPTRRRKEPFLGMTAPQRFVVSLLLFMMVCVVGAFALMLTEKMVMPFF
jgi:hypothetical protein